MRMNDLTKMLGSTDERLFKLTHDGFQTVVSESGESITLSAGISEETESSILAALANYPNVKNVYFVDVNITGRVADALLKLPELTTLSLSSSFFGRGGNMSFESLSFLRDAMNLTSLYLYATSPPIDISELTQLKSITADDNTLYDMNLLEPLHELEELSFLEYSNDAGYFPWTNPSNIKDVSPLKKLPKLRSLSLTIGSHDTDLSSFADLKQIKRLTLCIDNDYDITPIGELTQLDELAICTNNQKYGRVDDAVNGFNTLSTLTNLMSLTVPNFGIRCLEPVRNMTRLQGLYCPGNHIRSLKPIEAHTELRELDIEGNPIKDYAPIRRLPHYVPNWEPERKIK